MTHPLDRQESQKYFGVEYPYDKLDLAALAEFGSGAMENAGLVTFREEAPVRQEALAGAGAAGRGGDVHHQSSLESALVSHARWAQ